MSTPKIVKVLQVCYDQLVSCAFFSSGLVGRLYSNDRITTEEMEQVNSRETQSEKSRQLLDILSRKDDAVLDIVLAFLRKEPAHVRLWRVLNDAAISCGHFQPAEADQSPGPSKTKQRRIAVLPEKWWPDHLDLITSFVPRSATDGVLLVDHLRDQLLSTERKVTAIVAKKHAIVGMGGIGKTSTAKWYANTFEAMYDHVLWMDAEGAALTASFNRLGSRLGLRREEFSSLQEFAKEIYMQFEGVRVLVVFDNAERFEGENGLRNLLPRNNSHHALITSRNHEWGNSNEFGQIPTFELGVFTEEECVTLLTNALPTEGKKLGTRAEMVALGAELGFLPLALQCAVATIVKSKRYTLASYLARIKEDLLILVDKKVLSEYERTVSATLRLSVEQIEVDKQIDDGVREWCLVILNIAAYCEPTNVPETLFFSLPGASVDVLKDAVDQLLAYSLVSFEKLVDRRATEFRLFGIHRLLQHVIRHKVLVDSDRAIRAIKLAFECMCVDLSEFERHATHAWDLASAQFDEILLNCHSFPFQIAQMMPPPDVAFVRKALTSLLRIWKAWDLPIVQLQLALIHVLLTGQEDNEEESAEQQANEVLHSLRRVLTEHVNLDIPFKNELLLHLRIVELNIVKALNASGALDMDEVENNDDDRDAGGDSALWASCQELLDEMKASGYDGTIGSTRLFHNTQVRHKGLSLRMALVLNSLDFCDVDQLPSAICTLRAELLSTGDLDLDCVSGIHDYLLDSHAYVLHAVIPDLYELMNPTLTNLVSSSISGVIVNDQHSELILDVTKSYVQWMRRNNRSNSEQLQTLAAPFNLKWFTESATSFTSATSFFSTSLLVISRVLYHQREGEPLASYDMRSILHMLRNAWKNLALIIEDPSATPAGYIGESMRADVCDLLFDLNTVWSYATIKGSQAAKEVLELDQRTIKLFNLAAIDWLALHATRTNTKHKLPLSIASLSTLPNQTVIASDMQGIMRSKGNLLQHVIDLSTDKLENSIKHDHQSLPSVMETFDSLCFIRVFLRQFREAIVAWSASMLLITTTAPGQCRISLVAQIGRHTFAWLEAILQKGSSTGSEPEQQAMNDFMVDISKCVSSTLQNQEDHYCDFKLNDVLLLIRRLIQHGFQDLAAAFADRVAQDGDANMDRDENFCALKALLPDIKQLTKSSTSESERKSVLDLLIELEVKSKNTKLTDEGLNSDSSDDDDVDFLFQ